VNDLDGPVETAFGHSDSATERLMSLIPVGPKGALVAEDRAELDASGSRSRTRSPPVRTQTPAAPTVQ
jgi:hypothetical protein